MPKKLDPNLNFLSVPLEKNEATENLSFKIYLFVNNHFILYRNEEAEIDTETIRRLELKRVKFVFIEETAKSTFEKYVKSQETELENNPKLKEALNSKVGVTREKIRKRLEQELDKGPIEKHIQSLSQIAADSAKTLVAELSKRKPSSELLSILTKHSKGLYGHAINVSTISIHIAQKLGYLQEHILEYIGTAGLLHDIGKVKIDVGLLNKNAGEFTAAEEKLLMSHPKIGRDLLVAVYNVPNEIKLMVYQHHENHDGSGYPEGIKGSAIYELTKILSIVNTFEHFFQGIKRTGDVTTTKIIKLMKSKKISSRFDPVLLDKCLGILEDF
jgi:putative nucleotidyltransferase with HDIG domain